MKITLISFDNWGFNKNILETLKNQNHIVNHIDFSKASYKYPTFFHKIYNFILKAFFKQNLKTKFYGKFILNELEKINEKQDLILTIKGDFIAPEYAKKIKNYTDVSIAFFNDNTRRCPKIIRVISCFDKVYSFEREDCQKYNLEFKTNFIYNFKEKTTAIKTNNFEVFNISSYGKRSNLIIDIAKNLKQNKISYKFFIFDKKNNLKNNEYVDVIRKTVPLDVVNDYIEKSNVLLDIHRENQKGLSFRVFESLGLHKKLITTNPDIKNYDFFNEKNILIIDTKNPEIPLNFINSPYEEIPEKILNKYLVSNWSAYFINHVNN